MSGEELVENVKIDHIIRFWEELGIRRGEVFADEKHQLEKQVTYSSSDDEELLELDELDDLGSSATGASSG